MTTDIDKARFLMELIQEEMRSSRDNMLPLYDLYELCADYIALLNDLEHQKTIEVIGRRLT